MFYEGFVTGDKIKVIPTYRSLGNPFLRSDIRDLNNPGADYKSRPAILGTVVSETLNGIWVMTDGPGSSREFYEKDKYIFELIDEKLNNLLDFLNS